MATINVQKFSLIHEQLSNLRLQLLDTKIHITQEQAAASKFTIAIAKDLFKYIDHYKENQFSQLLEISEVSKHLVDQVLAYKSLHIDPEHPAHFFKHTLPLIDDIFESLTRELLLLQVKIKDLALNSSFSSRKPLEQQAEANIRPELLDSELKSLMKNSATLDKVLQYIESESKKRDKDFVLELIKREFSMKDGSKHTENSLKKHCRNMTLTQMEKYVCNLINSSTTQVKKAKNDVSLDDLLAISISKVPLTQRLRDWEQVSDTTDGVKSVIKGTKSIRRLLEMSPQDENSEIDPKKVKKIEFSGSYKKPQEKELPFTHSQIDKLVFAEEDTQQLSRAMKERRQRLRENPELTVPLEDSFTISTNVSGFKDMSLRSDIEKKFKRIPEKLRKKNLKSQIVDTEKIKKQEDKLAEVVITEVRKERKQVKKEIQIERGLVVDIAKQNAFSRNDSLVGAEAMKNQKEDSRGFRPKQKKGLSSLRTVDAKKEQRESKSALNRKQSLRDLSRMSKSGSKVLINSRKIIKGLNYSESSIFSQKSLAGRQGELIWSSSQCTIRNKEKLEVQQLDSQQDSQEMKELFDERAVMSRNYVRSALGKVNSSDHNEKGVLRSILHQQGRTTTATSVSDELPPIESFRGALPKKRVALEKKLRKLVVDSHHMSMPTSPHGSRSQTPLKLASEREAKDVRIRLMKK